MILDNRLRVCLSVKKQNWEVHRIKNYQYLNFAEIMFRLRLFFFKVAIRSNWNFDCLLEYLISVSDALSSSISFPFSANEGLLMDPEPVYKREEECFQSFVGVSDVIKR